MAYWLTCVGLAFAGYTLTQMILIKYGRRYLNVEVIDKDGTRRLVRVKQGRDPEIDELIRTIKQRNATE